MYLSTITYEYVVHTIWLHTTRYPAAPVRSSFIHILCREHAWHETLSTGSGQKLQCIGRLAYWHGHRLTSKTPSSQQLTTQSTHYSRCCCRLSSRSCRNRSTVSRQLAIAASCRLKHVASLMSSCRVHARAEEQN